MFNEQINNVDHFYALIDHEQLIDNQMGSLINKTFILLLILPILSASCNLDKFEYSHLLDPKDYHKYYEDLDLLRADLLEKGYEYEPHGRATALHETWEQVLDDYASTVIIRFENPEGKYDNDPIASFDTWITSGPDEKESPEFKRLIEIFENRIKQSFPILNTNISANGKLKMSDESGYSVLIGNDLEDGWQYTVVVNKE